MQLYLLHYLEGDTAYDPKPTHLSYETKTAAQNLWLCPAGYTTDDLERFLDLLYGMYSHVYTLAQLRQTVVSDPFDRSETPRQLPLTDLTDWLEALLL
jgi:hypothetical protein